MKSIVFGIVVLLTLQGCSYISEVTFSSRSINSCSSSFHPYNEKQCKKDKETLTKILGKRALEEENFRRNAFSYFVAGTVFYGLRVSPLIIPSIVGASL